MSSQTLHLRKSSLRKVLPWLALVVGGLLIVPFSQQELAAIALIGLSAIVATAAASIAVPLGLTGLPATIVSVLGRNPFPQKTVPLLIFVWLALGVFFALRSSSRLSLRTVLSSRLVVLNLALFALMLVRLPGSTDGSYGTFKTELFLISNLTVLFAGVILGSRPREIELFLLLTMIIDAASGLLILRQLGGSSTLPDRFGLLQQGVLSLGGQGVEGVAIAVFLVLRARRRWVQMVAVCAIPVTFVAVLASGSRGPVLGGALGLLSLAVLLAKTRGMAVRLLAVSAVAAGSFAIATQLVPASATSRALSTITGTQSGVSSNGRGEIWHTARQAFSNHPLAGIGTGSFATYDQQALCPGPACGVEYPHNILLEGAAELGIGGLALVAAILGAGAVLILRGWRHDDELGRYVPVLFAVFVANASDAMLTGDLTAHPEIWLVSGIALGLTLLAGPLPAHQSTDHQTGFGTPIPAQAS